jgi:hypothetical protein
MVQVSDSFLNLDADLIWITIRLRSYLNLGNVFLLLFEVLLHNMSRNFLLQHMLCDLILSIENDISKLSKVFDHELALYLSNDDLL